jgi:hypothetical protein
MTLRLNVKEMNCVQMTAKKKFVSTKKERAKAGRTSKIAAVS